MSEADELKELRRTQRNIDAWCSIKQSHLDGIKFHTDALAFAEGQIASEQKIKDGILDTTPRSRT